MNVYVASRFSPEGRQITRDLHARLEAAGHAITHDWTHEDKTDVDDLAECAMRDLDGVWDADVLIAVPFPHCRGLWVEFGVALARFMPIVVVSPPWRTPLCIFEHVPGVVHVDSMDAAVAWVTSYGRSLS